MRDIYTGAEIMRLWEELGLDDVDVSSLGSAPPPVTVSDMVKAATDAGFIVWWDYEAQAVKMAAPKGVT